MSYDPRWSGWQAHASQSPLTSPGGGVGFTVGDTPSQSRGQVQDQVQDQASRTHGGSDSSGKWGDEYITALLGRAQGDASAGNSIANSLDATPASTQASADLALLRVWSQESLGLGRGISTTSGVTPSSVGGGRGGSGEVTPVAHGGGWMGLGKPVLPLTAQQQQQQQTQQDSPRHPLNQLSRITEEGLGAASFRSRGRNSPTSPSASSIISSMPQTLPECQLELSKVTEALHDAETKLMELLSGTADLSRIPADARLSLLSSLLSCKEEEEANRYFLMTALPADLQASIGLEGSSRLVQEAQRLREQLATKVKEISDRDGEIIDLR